MPSDGTPLARSSAVRKSRIKQVVGSLSHKQVVPGSFPSAGLLFCFCFLENFILPTHLAIFTFIFFFLQFTQDKTNVVAEISLNEIAWYFVSGGASGKAGLGLDAAKRRVRQGQMGQ